MNFTEKIKPYFWTVPFFVCLLGYIVPVWFTPKTSLTTPQLVHRSLYDGLALCSQLRLNLQIIHELYDGNVAPGTILEQKPAAHAAIKQHQTIFVTVAKTPEPVRAPNCIGKFNKELKKIEQQEHIKIKEFLVPSVLPAGSCIAQLPEPTEPLVDKKMIIYTAQPEKNLYICPTFTGKNADDCAQQCLKYHIKATFFHDTHAFQPANLHDWTVIDQKPMPGTFINPAKDTVQLSIQPS